ncbi:MAG: hypothetical protein V1856_00740 [Candidatus Liptonbacteria bacterium]
MFESGKGESRGTENAPIETIEYKEYPGRIEDIPELGLERGKFEYVGQKGAGLVTFENTVQISEGFSDCVCLLVSNPKNNGKALVHVEPGGLDARKEATLGKLGPGSKEAIWIRGHYGEIPFNGEAQLKKMFGADNQRSITVETGEYWWGVVHKPAENVILVVTRSPNLIRTYQGFVSKAGR